MLPTMAEMKGLRALRDAPWQVRAIIPLCLAAAIVSLVAGGAGGLVMLGIGLCLVYALAVALVPGSSRRQAVTIIVVAYLARALIAAGLHLVLLQSGRGGALFLDDQGYVLLGENLARFWRGEEQSVYVDPSLANSYLSLVGIVFGAFGPNVLALKLMNVAFGVIAAILVYRTALLLTAERAARYALIAMLVFPSLVLWSSLALKDTFALACEAAFVWSVVQFVKTRDTRWIIVAVAVSLPLASARSYLFGILLVVWPIGLLIAFLPRARGFALRSAAATALIAASLITLTAQTELLSPNTFAGLESTRRNMASGARTGFVPQDQIVAASPGTAFVVVVPGITADPNATPRIVVVPVGGRVGYSQPSGGSTTLSPTTVAVQPGDIVLIAPQSADAPPASPAMSPQPLTLSQAHPTQIRSPESMETNSQIVRNIAYLPRGLLYLLFAPLPWEMRTLADLAAAPDLLVWYLVVMVAFVGLYRVIVDRGWDMAYPILVGGAIAAALSLIEGNVGTLVRHRAMVIPLAVLVASYGLPHADRWTRSMVGHLSSRRAPAS